jgi:hypothetical protein
LKFLPPLRERAAPTNGATKMSGFLRKLRRLCSEIVRPELFIVASRPFADKDGWKILYGTYTSFRILEFATRDAADREFEGIRGFVAYRLGDGVYDFVLLTAELTARVNEGQAYAEIVDQAIRARDVEEGGQARLASGLI